MISTKRSEAHCGNQDDRPLVLSVRIWQEERANIDKDELKVFQEVAKELLGFDDRQLATALIAGEIVEACNGNDEA